MNVKCVLSVFPKDDVLTDFNGPVPDQPEPRVCPWKLLKLISSLPGLVLCLKVRQKNQ